MLQDPEVKRARQRQHYAEHKEEYLARTRRYLATEQGKAKRREYYLATKGRWREASNARRRQDPERYRRELASAMARDPLFRRRKHLYDKYGISLDDYERMLAEQNGVCAVCGKPPAKKYLDVDHSHETGAVRGLLCRKCNTAVGYIEHLERVQFEAALNYLKRSRECPSVALAV